MQKILTMNRVLAAVISILLMLALVPTYAFASEDFNYSTALSNKTTEQFYQWLNEHQNDEDCVFGDDCGTHIGNRARVFELLANNIDNPSYWYTTHDWTMSIYPCGMFMMDSIEEILNDPSLMFGDDEEINNKIANSAFVQWLMSGNDEDYSSIISIETEASTINVTVPTNAAFIFKSDGTNVYPSNYEITNNNTLTAVTLDAIDFEGVNGWSLTAEDDTFQADVKKFALKMGLRDGALSVVDKANGVSFSGDTEIKIAPNGSKTLSFEAKRGVFSSPVTTENAMQMTMHFDWEHAA